MSAEYLGVGPGFTERVDFGDGWGRLDSRLVGEEVSVERVLELWRMAHADLAKSGDVEMFLAHLSSIQAMQRGGELGRWMGVGSRETMVELCKNLPRGQRGGMSSRDFGRYLWGHQMAHVSEAKHFGLVMRAAVVVLPDRRLLNAPQVFLPSYETAFRMGKMDQGSLRAVQGLILGAPASYGYGFPEDENLTGMLLCMAEFCGIDWVKLGREG